MLPAHGVSETIDGVTNPEPLSQVLRYFREHPEQLKTRFDQINQEIIYLANRVKLVIGLSQNKPVYFGVTPGQWLDGLPVQGGTLHLLVRHSDADLLLEHPHFPQLFQQLVLKLTPYLLRSLLVITPHLIKDTFTAELAFPNTLRFNPILESIPLQFFPLPEPLSISVYTYSSETGRFWAIPT